MPTKHHASQTECMHRIAFRHGFFWETLWNLPENQELKTLRKDPSCLEAGDEVFVPDKRERQEAGACETRHRFRRRGVPVKIRIRLEKDGCSEDYAGVPWRLEVEGKVHEGTLDEEGGLEVSLVPDASDAELRVKEGDEQEVFRLSLSGLDPVDTPRGAQQRLANLGLYARDPSDAWSPDAVDALKTFQRLYVVEEGEDPSGELDSQTSDRLGEVYELESATRDEARP